jgi:hypothetical protein
MKPILFTLLLGSFACLLSAQPSYDLKRDYMWITGFLGNTLVKHIYLDFKTDTMTLSHKEIVGQALYQTNSSISDSSGNLLFYSNGCTIVDSNYLKIMGADTINYGFYFNAYCREYFPYITNGYPIVNGCWALPVGRNNFKVIYAELLKGTIHLYTSKLKYAHVILDTATQKLKAINKDILIFPEEVEQSKRAVVRHANGRDWWVVNPVNDSKIHYSFFVDSTDNIYEPVINEFPEQDSMKITSTGQACFSPDGTKYVSFDYKNDCLLFDFDRCSGRLSNLRKVQSLVSLDTILAVTGIAISPNSRYLYLMTRTKITQYDLEASDISASGVTVAVNDGFTVLGAYITFYQSQLGPDGKIYVFPPGGKPSFSVIESPDSAGVACDVRQHKYVFPDWGSVAQPPRFPNFRLGPLEGSPCDSIPLVGTQAAPQRLPIARLKLSPNPASSHTVADITVSDYRPEQHLVLRLTDITGKVLRRVSVPAYTPLQRIETGGLAKGLYFVSLEIRGRVAVVEKLVVVD